MYLYVAQVFDFVADLFHTDRSLIGGIGCKGGLALFFSGSFWGLSEETGRRLMDMNIIEIYVTSNTLLKLLCSDLICK